MSTTTNQSGRMPQQSAVGCLKGVTVLCTGFPDHTRQELQKLVVDLGGSSTPNYSPNSPPNVLIAKSVLSPKYKVQSLLPWAQVCKASQFSSCSKHISIASTQNPCSLQAVVAAQPDITIVDANWLRACKHAGKKASSAAATSL